MVFFSLTCAASHGSICVHMWYFLFFKVHPNEFILITSTDGLFPNTVLSQDGSDFLVYCLGNTVQFPTLMPCDFFHLFFFPKLLSIFLTVIDFFIFTVYCLHIKSGETAYRKGI